MVRVLFLTLRYNPNTAIYMRMHYFKKALIEAGIDVIEYEISMGSKACNLLRYLWLRIDRKLYSICKNIDVIFTTTPPPILPLIAKKLHDIYGIEYVVDIRDAWEDYACTVYPRVVVGFIIRKYFKALKESAKLITVTEYLRDYYTELLQVKPVVIPNGTDPSIIKCKEEDHDPLTIVVLADFNHPYQDLEPILEALTLLPEIKLIVIGSGKYLHKYMDKARELMVNDRVEWIGHVKYNELPKFLCRASVGIVCRPSIETLAYRSAVPTKTYDYLAAGLAILGYGPKDAYLKRFLEEHGVGVYVEDAKPEIIAKALRELLEIANNIRFRAIKLAEEYSRPRLSRKLVEIIFEIAKR